MEITICVLDTDDAVSNALRHVDLLSRGGRQVVVITFTQSRTLLEYAKGHLVNLAIVEISMPEIDGLEVQRRLRQGTSRIAILMMSKEDTPALRSLALAQGAAAFLVKPFTEQALLGAIRVALPAAKLL